ncbi:hypothetical protein SOVF_200080, partial [Spinacia oleracea]
DGKDDVRVVEFISTLWALWLHRNEVVFKNSQSSAARVMVLVEGGKSRWLETRKLLQLQLGATDACNPKGKSKPFVWKAGTPTPGPFVSLVVDAAWKKIRKRKGSERGAAIAWKGERNEESHIQGWMRVCASCPVQAECLAIFEALKVACDHASNIIIKTDCQEVIDALRNPATADIRILHIIQGIISLASNSILRFVVCIKVSRLMVSSAHDLASQVRKGLI